MTDDKYDHEMNENSFLICGGSTGGKTASLRNIERPEGVLYLNCEAGKALPFKSGSLFKTVKITDPKKVFKYFDVVEKKEDCHTIVLDSLTYLMAMWKSKIFPKIKEKEDAFAAWDAYAEFFRELMQQKVAKSTKNVIVIAHTSPVLDENERVLKTIVKVSGQIMNEGVESFFNTVLAAKKVPITALDDFDNDHLEITPQDKLRGVKYVFQTMLTADTVTERIRGPMDLWSQQETYIDNDVQIVLNQLKNYYL